MKFPTQALHQVVILGASCIYLASAHSPEETNLATAPAVLNQGLDKSPEVGTRLRRRTEMVELCSSVYSWRPGMTLEVEDDNGACPATSADCDIPSSCDNEVTDEVILGRPTGYGDGVIHKVCINEICISEFSAANLDKSTCLMIPDGSGKYRGIRLSSSEDVEARVVFSSGEVECVGQGEFSECRTDYSWLPGMTLDVFDGVGHCLASAGCWIDRTSSDSSCPTNSSESFEIARPDNASNHTVQEVYSSAWSHASTSFHAAVGAESNMEDCLTYLGSDGKYGGIKLSSNPDTRVQAVVSEDGSVICRSLKLGDSCNTNDQCLSDICKLYDTGVKRCADTLLGEYGEDCEFNSDCASGICNRWAQKNAKCDTIPEGEIGAFCSRDQECAVGVCECTADNVVNEASICALSKAGETCDSGADCESGICKPYANGSNRCSSTLAAYGDYCNSNSDCASEICNSRVNHCDATPEAESGAMCSSDEDCRLVKCDGDYVIVAGGTSHPTCSPYEDQHPCASIEDCEVGQVCRSFSPASGLVCLNSLGQGNDLCGDESDCENVPCTQWDDGIHRCTLLSLDESCEVDSQCESEICRSLQAGSEKFCQATRASYGSYCESGSNCIDGICNPYASEFDRCDKFQPKTKGAMCTNYSDCNYGGCPSFGSYDERICRFG